MPRRSDGPDPTTTVTAEVQSPISDVVLVVIHGQGTKLMPLCAGTAVTVGRAYPSDVVVASDPSLSRQHARITSRADGTALVEDLESHNGTFLGEERLQRTELRPGLLVRLGKETQLLLQTRVRLQGIDGYDAFDRWLRDEVARSQTFGRTFCLLGVLLPDGPPLAGATAGVIRLLTSELRAVDRAGMHSRRRLLVGLTETEAAGARELAERLAGMARSVTCACFPSDASSADALVTAALGGAPVTPTETPRSGPMQALLEEARRLARSRLPVLIRGETGSGKEVVARLLHESSGRQGRFLPQNCGAFARTLLEAQLFGHERGAFTGAHRTGRGAFEQASGGTLFLDEVGELSLEAQAALLRVLETQTIVRLGGEDEVVVDARVVAATHRDLEAMVAAGTFREDLLYRLEGATLRVPPLRERPEDLEPLARLFIEETSSAEGLAPRPLSAAARAALLAYPFPGNVRELRNALLRAVVMASGSAIEVEDLPEKMRPAPGRSAGTGTPEAPYHDRIREELQRFEATVITEALARAGGNQTAAARELKLPLRTLTHKIRELGIKVPRRGR